MDNRERGGSNHEINPTLARKSLFVLNSGKTNSNVNAVSFALNANLPRQSRSSCNSIYSHYGPDDRQMLKRDLIITCNPRTWSNISCRNIVSCTYGDHCRRQQTHRRHSECSLANRTYQPVVLPNGIFQVILRDGIKIDITLDKAVRLTSIFQGIDVAFNAAGTDSSVVHPNGKINQSGADVEVVAFDGTHRNDFVRYAKFCEKAISFTSSASALVYRIDSGGVRSTGDTITDLQTENTVSTFLSGSRYGRNYFEEAMRLVGQSTFQRYDDRTDEILINGIRILQKPYGVVKIHRLDNNITLSTNPDNYSYSLTTPEIHSTAALKHTPHLFVRRATQRVHFNGCCFLVRYDGNSAGLDDNNFLRVY